MKLLLDENLSPRLCAPLAALYPGTCHVRDLGLQRSPDELVWARALADGFTIVSKDDDFRELSVRLGYPPKVVRINFGNCSTATAEAGLRHYSAAIYTLQNDPAAGYLELTPP